MYDLEKIRELTALWVKERLHRHRDAYTAAIYFLLSDQYSVVNEGLDLLNWSLNQAIALNECGRHAMPLEEEARKQISALAKHQPNLPKILKNFGSMLIHNNIPDPKTKEVLYQLFLHEFTTPEIVGSSAKFTELDKECRALSEYFHLGISTLRRALTLIMNK